MRIIHPRWYRWSKFGGLAHGLLVLHWQIRQSMSLCHHVTNPLQWRHNGCDGHSNHQPHDCLLNRSFRRRSKKISKFRVTGLRAGSSPVTGEFPAQRASNAENVSIWRRHHAPCNLLRNMGRSSSSTREYCNWIICLAKCQALIVIQMIYFQTNPAYKMLILPVTLYYKLTPTLCSRKCVHVLGINQDCS